MEKKGDLKEEKKSEGEEEELRASIFASEGTVAVAFVHLPFENLSARNHECPLATAPMCVPSRSYYVLHDYYDFGNSAVVSRSWETT